MRRAGALLLSAAMSLSLVVPARAQSEGRGGGPVRLDGRALANADGPWLPLGASLFWALWGERHDPERLDRNLAWLADRGVDYVRVLGMVGTDTWSDRRIDPLAPDYWDVVDQLFARLARHGLRVQVTIFADAQVMMPRRSDREAFVDAWARRAEANRARLMLFEIANEHWQNGVADVAELRALGRRLADGTRVLVALSAARSAATCDVYAGSAADLATVHYGRAAADNPWLIVAQPRSWPDAYDDECRGRLPVAVNNEPIGPRSSVEGDDDPLRLAMAFVATFVAGNAAYVLHSGAGIRGGGEADLAAGRAADFADVPNLSAALAGIARARERLPRDLANWQPLESTDRKHPFTGFEEAVTGGSLAAAPGARSDGRFVIAVLGLARDVTLRARTPLVVDVLQPLGTDDPRRVTLDRGERLRLRGADAFVLIGRSL